MKIRLEIIDGSERVNVEFEGDQWKEYLMGFIESIGDKFPSDRSSSKNTPQETFSDHNTSHQQQVMGQQQVPQNTQYYPQYYPPVPQGGFYYPQPQQYQPQMQPQQYNPAMQPQQAFQPHIPQQQHNRVKANNERMKLHERLNDASLTINERLELFLKYEYPNVWFTSQDIQKHYEKIYGKIKLSTVSTYLSRMYRRKLLERRGNRTQREYKYIISEEESIIPEYAVNSQMLRT